MADLLTREQRSKNMAQIRSTDTSPEMAVRRLLHSMGYRYRLHAKDLPGKPDIVFRSRKKAVFVHGCFWHQHTQCREGRVPSSNREYWPAKLLANVSRDERNQILLKKAGWTVLVVWECQVRDETVGAKLKNFLNGSAY